MLMWSQDDEHQCDWGSSAVYGHRPMPVSVPAELEASLDERERLVDFLLRH